MAAAEHGFTGGCTRPFKLLLPVIGVIYDKKLLNNIKADLEGAA